jgi:hypothetical protein
MTFVRHKSDTHDERYFHVKIPNGRYAGCTFFFRKEGGLWLYAIAMCSNVDQFQKRVGRNIARRRYFTDRNAGFAPLSLVASVGGAAGAEPTYDNCVEIYNQQVEILTASRK